MIKRLPKAKAECGLWRTACPSAVGHFARHTDKVDSKVRQENFWTVGMRDNDSDDWRLSGIGIAMDEKFRGCGLRV